MQSRFVARTAAVRDTSTPAQWILSLAAMARELAPALIVPCDEIAFRLLSEFVRLQPRPVLDRGESDLRDLVRRSLGDPAHYQTSVDKTALPGAARALGIPVPAYAIARTDSDAAMHAARLGYPVVLKRRFGFASQGVAVARGPEALAAAAGALLQPMQVDLGVPVKPRLLVQSFVEGRTWAMRPQPAGRPCCWRSTGAWNR